MMRAVSAAPRRPKYFSSSLGDGDAARAEDGDDKTVIAAKAMAKIFMAKGCENWGWMGFVIQTSTE